MEQSGRVSGVVVVVRGVGDIGSAVAHRLFREGYHVAIHDDPRPTATRRGMAFTDAVFDGRAVLDGIEAVRVDELGDVAPALGRHETIPLYVGPWTRFLSTLEPRVLIDARMRKHSAPEGQRGSADVTIGLGPSLVAGLHADVVIETSWDDLGRVIRDGASRPLAGEPREIQGHARNRYVYAPVAGVFHTNARIGDAVRRGKAIATIDDAVLTAPLDGVLRGLTRDGVPVAVRTKVIEVDPRSRHAEVRGIAERPRRIADAVLSVITATIGRGARD